jgi:hypothetical protein
MSKVTLGEHLMASQVKYKVSFYRSYASKKHNKEMYIYLIEDEDVEVYKHFQGRYYRVDEATGKAMYFSSQYFGEEGKLVWSDHIYWSDSGKSTYYGSFYPEMLMGY